MQYRHYKEYLTFHYFSFKHYDYEAEIFIKTNIHAFTDGGESTRD